MALDVKRLEKKVCVVTGAARSIGLAVAERFAGYGATVVMLDVNPLVLEEAEKLQKAGKDVHGYIADLTDHDTVMRLFDQVVETYGPVFSLVNAAGVGAIGHFEDTRPEEWERVLKINVLGTVYCIQGAIRSMREQGEGKIINMASKAGKSGSKFMTVYGASKGAIITLTQALAQEYAPHHININCLCPDIVKDTGIANEVVFRNYSECYGMSEEEVVEMYEKKVPLGRFATREDLCDVISFYTISADDCTGQSINVTGGRTMH